MTSASAGSPPRTGPSRSSLDGTLVVMSSGTLVTDRDSVSGLDYTVASSVPVLRATAEQQAATAAKVPAELAPYTALPADVPDEIAATARQIVTAADATTPYDEAARAVGVVPHRGLRLRHQRRHQRQRQRDRRVPPRRSAGSACSSPARTR